MALVEKLQPGVNGAILPVTQGPYGGYVFEAPDGTRGPFRAAVGTVDVRAFAMARKDWRDYLNGRRPQMTSPSELQ